MEPTNIICDSEVANELKTPTPGKVKPNTEGMSLMKIVKELPFFLENGNSTIIVDSKIENKNWMANIQQPF